MNDNREYENRMGALTHSGVGYAGLPKIMKSTVTAKIQHSGVGYGGLYE